MKFQRLSLILLLFMISLSASAYGRKPAVEDFVGVEPQDYNRTPQGTEVAFDFGNRIKAESVPVDNTNLTSSLVLISFILLPFAMWFGITRKGTQNDEQPVQLAQVKNIQDYQQKSDDEDVKKAS